MVERISGVGLGVIVGGDASFNRVPQKGDVSRGLRQEFMEAEAHMPFDDLQCSQPPLRELFEVID
jgi:hypothetical protein